MVSGAGWAGVCCLVRGGSRPVCERIPRPAPPLPETPPGAGGAEARLLRGSAPDPAGFPGPDGSFPPPTPGPDGSHRLVVPRLLRGGDSGSGGSRHRLRVPRPRRPATLSLLRAVGPGARLLVPSDGSCGCFAPSAPGRSRAVRWSCPLRPAVRPAVRFGFSGAWAWVLVGDLREWVRRRPRRLLGKEAAGPSACIWWARTRVANASARESWVAGRERGRGPAESRTADHIRAQPWREATLRASADFLLAAAFLWMTPFETALSS